MARSQKKRTYIADPERRAHYNAIRTVRLQVYKEYQVTVAGAGFLRRIFLRIRIEREIRRRCRVIGPARRP
jgi:hypothetical protein